MTKNDAFLFVNDNLFRYNMNTNMFRKIKYDEYKKIVYIPRYIFHLFKKYYPTICIYSNYNIQKYIKINDHNIIINNSNILEGTIIFKNDTYFNIEYKLYNMDPRFGQKYSGGFIEENNMSDFCIFIVSSIYYETIKFILLELEKKLYDEHIDDIKNVIKTNEEIYKMY